MLAADTGKILVVDDHEPSVHHLSQLLELAGYDVVVAYSGEEALSLLQQETVDLMLLDVMMPIITGLEVLVIVRQRYTMEELPVILLSALADDSDIVKGLNQQANDYFTKPVSPDIVMSRVRTHITLKHMADERRKMMNALQHANAMSGRLMRIASHDLRDPLNTLTMIHNLLEKVVPPDEETQDLLEMADRITENMNDIITEFLNLDILSGDEIRVKLGPLDLQTVLRDLMTDFSHSATAKDIAFEVDLSPATVIADDRRLRQVLGNLLSNAIKYSPVGAVVRLRGTIEDEGYRLHIIDEGQGIPPAEAHKLFQPFGKLSTQPTGGEQSTGLGLWIVKQMITAQKGDVGLNTSYTDGSDFWVQMPLAHVQQVTFQQL